MRTTPGAPSYDTSQEHGKLGNVVQRSIRKMLHDDGKLNAAGYPSLAPKRLARIIAWKNSLNLKSRTRRLEGNFQTICKYCSLYRKDNGRRGFPFGRTPTEDFAILQVATKVINGHEKKLHICSDSQAASKSILRPMTCSALVQECRDEIEKLARTVVSERYLVLNQKQVSQHLNNSIWKRTVGRLHAFKRYSPQYQHLWSSLAGVKEPTGYK